MIKVLIPLIQKWWVLAIAKLLNMLDYAKIGSECCLENVRLVIAKPFADLS
jgi:hypothetical protein